MSIGERMNTRAVTLLWDRLMVVMFAIAAARNFDSGNHYWMAVWIVFDVLAIIDYGHDLKRTWPARKPAK